MSVITSIVASSLLLIPRGGDPSAQPLEVSKVGLAAFEMPSAYICEPGATAVTYSAWMRCRDVINVVAGQLAGVMPQVTMMTSYDPARATREGGDDLTDLLNDLYSVDYVPLIHGSWSASNILLGRDDLAPETLQNWKYGCYCINYKSDSPFTLYLGGEETYLPASPTNAIRNIIVTSSDRSVAITAESASAHINFGVAHNPLVQFIGLTSDSVDTFGLIHTECGGIVTNEWRMCVFRARIADGKVASQLDVWRPNDKCTLTPSKQEDMWHPRSAFAVNSRVRITLSHMVGLTNPETGDSMTALFWGAKGRAEWMSDEDLEKWRDADYREIVRRGMDQ